MRYKLTKSVTFHEVDDQDLLAWLRESGKFDRYKWSPFVRRCLTQCMAEEKADQGRVAAPAYAAVNGNSNGHLGGGGLPSDAAQTVAQVVAQALDERDLSLQAIRQMFDAAIESAGVGGANGAPEVEGDDGETWMIDMLQEEMVL